MLRVVPPLSALFEIVTGYSMLHRRGSRAARSGYLSISRCTFKKARAQDVDQLGKLAGHRGAKVRQGGRRLRAKSGVAGPAELRRRSGHGGSGHNSMVELCRAEAEADAGYMAACNRLSVAIDGRTSLPPTQSFSPFFGGGGDASAMTPYDRNWTAMIPPIGNLARFLVGCPMNDRPGFPLPSFRHRPRAIETNRKGLKVTGVAGRSFGELARHALKRKKK